MVGVTRGLRQVLPSPDSWDSWTCARSEMLGAMLPGIFPDMVPVLVEDERWVGLRDPPSALFDLMFELVRSPAGVAEGDENLCWPLRSPMSRKIAVLDVIERRSMIATVSGRR
jgi:hypothetical protein